MELTIIEQNQSRTVTASSEQTLLEVLRTHGDSGLHAPCGGKGTCQKCTVYLVTPDGEHPVLACQTAAQTGMVVRLPERARLSVETAGTTANSIVPDDGLTGYGVACDIGTTTVVCHLISLSDGTKLATLGQGNAQRSYGGDVISRIKAAEEGHLPALTQAITGQLSELILTLCKQSGIAPGQITRMAVAANTTMCHLLTGLDPSGLGKAPFTPLSLFGTCVEAQSLRLPFTGAVYIAPAVSGYVGGDITADLLSVGLDRAETPVLLIDVGTNGEMALGCGERFVCCSTAAGPAFEGAQITCGMTAAPGAISGVAWKDGALRCDTVEHRPAVGLCGSGLIDAVAVMLELGAVDETGRMMDPEEDEEELDEAVLPYLFLTESGEPAFRLADQVYVTQSDIRKLQLGKGAIAAGVQVLMQAYGADFDDIGKLLLAGGFGSYIRPASAARIGLIPAELADRTRAIGNAAAEGAAAALVSSAARERLARLQAGMDYLELSGLPAFNEAYMESMLFPEEE